jgi:hypothetical protein
MGWDVMGGDGMLAAVSADQALARTLLMLFDTAVGPSLVQARADARDLSTFATNSPQAPAISLGYDQLTLRWPWRSHPIP